MVRPSTIANPMPQPEGGENLAGTTHTNPTVPAAFDPRDRADPLYLHPNENLALQIVTVQLEGRTNYHAWARAMEMALRSKNKMAFVNDMMLIPSETDPKYF
nr:receptor-like protein 12 [Ipomoea batatas]